MTEYKLLKQVAISSYQNLIEFLLYNDANEDVVNYYLEVIDTWEIGLEHNSLKLYRLESSRSYALDIHDDLSGQSCTINTVFKIRKMIEILNETPDYYEPLWFDKDLKKYELISIYNQRLIDAQGWLIK